MRHMTTGNDNHTLENYMYNPTSEQPVCKLLVLTLPYQSLCDCTIPHNLSHDNTKLPINTQ